MKTIVINTSKEAKDTKLDVLFKAPFDSSSLLWLDSTLPQLEETAQMIKHNLLEEADTVDRDYQLIVLIDSYQFPFGNEKNAVAWYKVLMERYVLTKLVEKLYTQLNLPPRGVCIYLVDSSRIEQAWDVSDCPMNPTEERQLQEQEQKAQLKKQKSMLKRKDGDLCDDFEDYEIQKDEEDLTPEQKTLMKLFGWSSNMTKKTLSWKMKVSVSTDETVDFADVFQVASHSIEMSDISVNVLRLALEDVELPRQQWRLSCVGRFPVYTLDCFVSRENEQSKLEGFFCVFANIFTCVQEKTLYSQVIALEKEQIRSLLIAALKKYKHFSAEENIKVRFEPIERVFKQRNTIFERRKKDVNTRSEFKDKTDEEVAALIMSEFKPAQPAPMHGKLHGLDRKFYEVAEQIFGNYDEELIRAQNNRIVKSCLERLWSWRDKQTREEFRSIVDAAVPVASSSDETAEGKREAIAFLQEEYEIKRDELINQVTDAENKLATNKNILLETKDMMLKYGDWMRKGMWSMISFAGAIFTILATVFPFFYSEWSIGNQSLSFTVNLLALLGGCAFLYSVAAGAYIAYINRKKQSLIYELNKLLEKSEEDRKASIIALYRYYNDTIVEAESYSLLWREICRRDEENAKKGIKRNYHIQRLKNLAHQVERFITMLKLDVPSTITADEKDLAEYAKQGLQIDGEESYYQLSNRRVYCLLPEKDTTTTQKGDTEEA